MPSAAPIRRLIAFAALSNLVAVPAEAQRGGAPVGQDYTIHNFRFESGETLPELRIHYITLGKPRRDASGLVRNAVMVLHGTTGSGSGFMSRTFGGELFGPGQLLDTAKYFVVLPDGIGHGKSSKPSDGMHARFPKYTYNDMVDAQHELLDQGPRRESPPARDGNVDGVHARVGVGRALSRLRRRAGAAGLRADTDRRAQSYDPHDDHGLHHARIRATTAATTRRSRRACGRRWACSSS